MNTRVRASAGCLGSGILSRAETPRCGGVFTGLTGLRKERKHKKQNRIADDDCAGCYGSGEGDCYLVPCGGIFRRSCLRVGITRHEEI